MANKIVRDGIIRLGEEVLTGLAENAVCVARMYQGRYGFREKPFSILPELLGLEPSSGLLDG